MPKTDRFGVELEFTAIIAHIANQSGTFYDILRKRLEANGVFGWEIHQDGSCGNEIVSPKLIGEEGLKKTLHICSEVNNIKESIGIDRLIGPDCGIHFHFDATKFSTKELRNSIILAFILEPLIYSMNPSSRFETNFAAPLYLNLLQIIRARDIIDIRDAWFRSYMGVYGHNGSSRHVPPEYNPKFINGGTKPEKYDWTRYHGFNLVSYFHHGTIEFRYAHGSFDEYVVEMWYRLYNKIVDIAVSNSTRRIVSELPQAIDFNMIKDGNIAAIQEILYSDLNRLIRMIHNLGNIDFELLKFIVNRLYKFNGANINENMVKLFRVPRENRDVESILKIMSHKPLTSNYYRLLCSRLSPVKKKNPVPVGENEDDAMPPPEFANALNNNG